ncbi:hypothetical protein BH11PSE11_BH11PSE11_01530 [soil metagenome]
MGYEESDAAEPADMSARPWIDLTTSHDVEAWIDHFNRDLQRCIKAAHPGEHAIANLTGYGACFSLREGGELYLHTTEDAILLDLTPEAEWVAPVLTAATGIEAPNSQIWRLPEDRMTQLILGLSSLIASSRLVTSHNYKTRKF